jgi:hypothetical protein
VDFGKEKIECMGVDHQHIQPGDEVVCVLRRLYVPNEEELIPYGIKVKKVSK